MGPLVTTSTGNVVARLLRHSYEQHLAALPPSLGSPPYLAVQAQEDEHHEEQGGPQWGERHHGDSLGVSDEGQARAWRGRRQKKVLGGVQALIQLF